MSGADHGAPRGSYVVEPSVMLLPDGQGQRVVRDVALRVRGTRITDVGDVSPGTGEERIVMDGQILLPGFISSHTHVAGAAPTRAIIEPKRGNYAIVNKIYETLDDDDLDALTRFSLAALIRTGCTTQVEMSLSRRQLLSYLRVAREFGARGYPSSMVPGADRLFDFWGTAYGPPKLVDDELFDQSVAGTIAEIEESYAIAKEWNGACNGRIRTMMGPHATDTHTPETIDLMVKYAAELGNGLHIHLAQSSAEAQAVYRRWGLRPAEWLDRLQAFDVPVIGAHMSGIDLHNDPPLLAGKRFLFSTCPFDIGVNGQLQPFPEMLAAGAAVGIGVDEHNMDFIETLKMAVVKGQARHSAIATPGVPSAAPTIDDVVLGATRVTADVLGRADLGRIQTGALADLVSVKITGLTAGSGMISPEPLSNLLYACGHDVVNVMIDGDWKVRDGVLQFADEPSLEADCGRAVSTIWKRLREFGWFTHHIPAFDLMQRT